MDQQRSEYASRKYRNKKTGRQGPAQLTDALDIGPKKCWRLDHHEGIRVADKGISRVSDLPRLLRCGRTVPILAWGRGGSLGSKTE